MKNLKYILLGLMLMFQGCTFSFNNIATEGKATDVLDEQQSPDVKVDPVLDIPATTL